MHSVLERDKLHNRSTQKYLGPVRSSNTEEGRTGPGTRFPSDAPRGAYTLPYLSDSFIRLGTLGTPGRYLRIQHDSLVVAPHD